MTIIITLVGDLGSGKTTLGAVLDMIAKYQYPDEAVISNVTTPWATKIDDIHKFISIKLLRKDKRYAFCLDDEAAQSGLESRGSGTKAAAIESRVITHARKAHVDLVLISQLKSMLDKRAQWVEDFSILCEAEFIEGNLTTVPNYFHYTVYDKYLEVRAEFEIDTEDLITYVWPWMDTDDIPFFSSFQKQLTEYYEITPSDHNEWVATMQKAMAPIALSQ